MVSTCFFPRTFFSRLAIVATAIALVALPGATQAQTTSSSSSPGYSSSSDWQAALAKLDMPAAPSAKASAQYGQYGRRNNRRYPYYNSNWSHFAFEIGAGPTAPIGNASRDWETWGYNVNVGAGWNFSRYFGALIEYQFNRMKIPGHTLTALAIDNGIPQLGGNINIWSFTFDPIVYMPVSPRFGAYVTGGGGFYRKVTNFTEPALSTQCDYYYFYCYSGYTPVTVAHSSSNQLGANLGLGLYWNAFGDYSNAKLFAETRYVYVNSPLASSKNPYGSGTTEFMPVTVGLRF
jgi:hypothetical protein